MDPGLIENLKRRVQQELRTREREVLEYWLGELEKIYRKKHQTLPELKSELHLLMEKMRNRLSVIQTKGI